MGETLTIKESGKADFNITAFDPNYDLVNVKLIKNVITGSADEGEAEIIFNKDLEGQGLKEFKTTLSLDVKAGEFYRIEVTSEQGTTGNGGKGEGQGLGFAFSNPIWIGSGAKSNAADIKEITYDGGQVIETVGNTMVIAAADTFSVDKLNVKVSKGATVSTEVIDAVDGELDTAAAVKITVTAEDGTKAVETVFLTRASRVNHGGNRFFLHHFCEDRGRQTAADAGNGGGHLRRWLRQDRGGRLGGNHRGNGRQSRRL